MYAFLMVYLIVGEVMVLLSTIGPGMRAALDRAEAQVIGVEKLPKLARLAALFLAAMFVGVTMWLPFILNKMLGRGK